MRMRGFSLIEVMVTLALLVTLGSLAAPAFQAAIGNAQIRTVAESIRNGLQLARIEAIKRNSRVRFVVQNDGSWQIGCVTVTTSCPATITQKSAVEGASSTTLISADNSSAVFSGFGTRDPAAASALTVVNISNTQVAAAEQRSLRVQLAAGGTVKVCDPSVTSSGDTRAC